MVRVVWHVRGTAEHGTQLLSRREQTEAGRVVPATDGAGGVQNAPW